MKAGAFLVLYLGWNCTMGGCKLSVPGAAKPLVCKAQPEREAFETFEQAKERVRELGPEVSPRVTLVQGTKLYDREYEWEPRF